MKIAISGINGYIGKNLCVELKKLQFSIVSINRQDLYTPEKLSEQISDVEIVINLAGSPILQRWNENNKKEIYKSRISTTQNIVQAINKLPDQKKPKVFISASAIGIYENGSIHTEESKLFSTDFVGSIVNDWENASANLSPIVRRVIFRIAPILGNEAQIIKKMWPLFQIGLGGKIGSGKQPFPFIHIKDAISAILWSIQNENVQGIYNLVAPDNINNKEFTKALSRVIGKPTFFTVPKFILNLIYGKASSILLNSPVVHPKKLLDEGFIFIYADIFTCLEEIKQS